MEELVVSAFEFIEERLPLPVRTFGHTKSEEYQKELMRAFLTYVMICIFSVIAFLSFLFIIVSERHFIMMYLRWAHRQFRLLRFKLGIIYNQCKYRIVQKPGLRKIPKITRMHKLATKK